MARKSLAARVLEGAEDSFGIVRSAQFRYGLAVSNSRSADGPQGHCT